MAGAAAADAFAKRTWAVAFRLLSQVPLAELTHADLDRLAVAAYLIGEDSEAVATWEHAYKRHAYAGERAEAARCAFWAAFCLMMRGQMAHAGGWLRRGQVKPAGVVCDGYRVIFMSGQALSAGMGTSSVLSAVSVTGRRRQRARTSRPR